MIDNCPWCELEYDLTTESEQKHLVSCPIFQTLPVAEMTPEGQTFVALPSDPNILVERRRKIQ